MEIGRELFQMFTKRAEVKLEWDGDLSKLTDSQLSQAMYFFERAALGEEAAQARLAGRRKELEARTIDVTPEPAESEPAAVNQEESDS
jgi:hypothetical protein